MEVGRRAAATALLDGGAEGLDFISSMCKGTQGVGSRQRSPGRVVVAVGGWYGQSPVGMVGTTDAL